LLGEAAAASKEFAESVIDHAMALGMLRAGDRAGGRTFGETVMLVPLYRPARDIAYCTSGCLVSLDGITLRGWTQKR
jgi:hypothetical protein